MTDKEIRNKILIYLHNVFKTSPSERKSTDEIAGALGILHLEAKRALIYLHEKGLIDSAQDEHYNWYQKINADGIDEAEKLESEINSQSSLVKIDQNMIAKMERISKEIYRLKRYYKTLRELLEVHFSGDTVVASEDANFYYLQLCVEIGKILDRPYFLSLSKRHWRPFDNLLSIDPDYPEGNWELGGRQSCADFQSKVEEIFIQNGKQEYELDSVDTNLFNAINLFLIRYRDEKKESDVLRRNVTDMLEDLNKQKTSHQIETKTPLVKPKKTKKLSYSLTIEKFEEILAKVNEFFEEGMPSNDETVNELLEEIYDLMKSSFLDGQSKIFSFSQKLKNIDNEATDDFAENASNAEKGDIYRYVNSKKLEFIGSEIGKLIKELIQLNKEETGGGSFELRASSESEQYESVPLEIENMDDDFAWNVQIFISHKFVQEDRKLASTLKSILRKKEIFGYIADKKKEYTLPIDEKIQNSIRESQFLVAVITNESLKSASVNQEIGFALGYEVPVALMIEKGLVPEGVFTKGRDVEEFTRKNFSVHCENIINYILGYIEENKNSIKLSKNDKELVKQQVYEHCYNVMKNIYDKRKYLDEIPPNPWRDITHALKLKTEPAIKDLFEKYSQELDTWTKLYMNWLTDFGNHANQIMTLVGNSFHQANILAQNEMIMLPQGRQTPLRDWVHHFKTILFDPSINDATTLYAKLLDFELSTTKWQEPFLKHFHEKTDVFRNLITIMKEIQGLLTDVPYEDLFKQRKVLNDSIEKLTDALAEKIKGN